ncbi:MAG: enoyl-CoA hydratase/carnithine racemase [Ramlibacter sp.]|nr:enoyl-CoA hydratase/carnithine racemase [Ramlibacter sp.]
MAEDPFVVLREGAVARIVLNREGEGNALTRGMMRDLSAKITELGEDTGVHVVVLEARGPQFCRGRDGKGESRVGLKPHEVWSQMMGAVLGVYQAISAAPIPVVARLQGDAIGFGAALAIGCDVTLATEQCRLSLPEIEHGIPPTLAISAALGKVPLKALSYLVYSAEPVDATRAVQLGMVSKTYPAGDFESGSLQFVRGLAERPRLVLETIKRYMTKAPELSPAMAAEYAGVLLAVVRS